MTDDNLEYVWELLSCFPLLVQRFRRVMDGVAWEVTTGRMWFYTLFLFFLFWLAGIPGFVLFVISWDLFDLLGKAN